MKHLIFYATAIVVIITVGLSFWVFKNDTYTTPELIVAGACHLLLLILVINIKNTNNNEKGI